MGCATANASVNTYATIEEALYTASKGRAASLLVITTILQICAIATLILRLTTRAPDILGYISTMTRGNVHTAVPSGGNTLDGVERARYLASMRFRLVDVRPEEEVGHISLSSDGLLKDSTIGRLDRKRRYA